MQNSEDIRYMRVALGLARRGLGDVWPNPAVGCVLVRDGVIVGRGWTQPGGRPHAEAEALRRAGSAANVATAYVTLEPCCHVARTPPCADALIAAGVTRVAASIVDPDPRVSGKGIARLREAGLTVTVGVCAEEAREVNAGFLLRVTGGRPLVTLKLATTLDGRIATRSGESRWITGPQARLRAHALRAENDAVMVGSNTVFVDDPELTCRLPGLGRRSPVRIIVDSRLRTPLTAKLVAQARQVPTWLVTLAEGDAARKAAFRDCGAELIEVEPAPAGVDLRAALHALAARGLTRVLAEGGSVLAASLLRADLVDRIAWFRSPRPVGGDGLAAVAAFGLDRLADAPAFRRTAIEEMGDDVLETFARRD
jgi:diaminohydroxyphosphoribosylaminopyrimidine deaminase/5-amino-6-(5-phosphoribosylamino)uracil reductase